MENILGIYSLRQTLINYITFIILKRIFGARITANLREQKWWRYNLNWRVLVVAAMIGTYGTIFIDAFYLKDAPPLVQEVEASEIVEVIQKEERKTVRIEVIIDWTPERVEQEIRNTFPEEPNTAVAVAICESGIRMVQSNHILDYGRELSFGIFQVHKPDWHQVAIRNGLPNYQTDIGQNLKMARIIYDLAGKRFTDWTCFNSGEYKKYL